MILLSKGFTGIAAAGLMVTATAFGQAPVSSPPADPANPPTNIQAGPVTIQSGPAGTNVTLPPAVGAPLFEQIRENAAIRQEERQAAREDWRMRNANGQWWYWNPNNSWSLYQDNAWMPYNAAVHANFSPPPAPNAPALAPGAAQSAVGPAVVGRRGPLGLRRYSVGYRGYGPAPIATAPPATIPTPGVPTPATPPSASLPNAPAPTNP